MFSFCSFAQKEVSFANQNINVLPYSLQNNKDLEYLDLSYCSIEKLPKWLSKFPNLKSINLKGTRLKNPLNDAQIITECKALTNLIWSNAFLAYFPIPLINCKNLKELNLEGNAIHVLPKKIGMMGVIKLNLSNNLIDSLPNEITKMQFLNELNISFNPAIHNGYNFKLLAKTKKLRSLILQGCNTVVKELGELNQIKSIDLSFSTFKTFPIEVKNLTNIESLKFYQSNSIEIHELIEQLSLWKKINFLHIGSSSFNRLPFNINKLPNLKTLVIQNSCLIQSPNSIQKLPLQNIHFLHCELLNFNEVLSPFLQNQNMKNLYINDCKIQNYTSDLNLGKKDTVVFTNNKMFDFPFMNGQINYLNIEGNFITKKSLDKVFINKTDGALLGDYLNYSTDFASAKKINLDSSHTAYKITVYANIGGIFTLPNHAQLHVPNDAFLDINHQTIKGDVVMHFTFLQGATDLLLNDIPLWDKDLQALHLLNGFKLELYHNGKPAFVSNKNPLKIIYQTHTENPLTLQYNSQKKYWENTNVVIKDCELKPDIISSNPFKIYMFNQLKGFSNDNQVSLYRGNIQLKLKHNKQKESLNFDLIADEDYGLNVPGLTNSFTLAYPELKTYQNIRWNYMGRELNDDLIKLLNLSLQPELDKIGRKSTFLVKSNLFTNVFLYPNPDEDNYIFEFTTSTDTVKIPVLPYIAIIKPKKIQRWHRKKYEEYENKYNKRQAQWAELDSAFVKALYRNQKKLQQIAQNYTDNVSNNSNPSTNDLFTSTSFISQTGWNILAKPLIENDWEIIHPVFYINNKQNFSKECLIYNQDKKYFYWSNTKEIMVPSNTNLQVFVKVGKQFVYSASLNENSNKVFLNKVE